MVVTFSLDTGPRFSYKPPILLIEGSSTGDSRLMERVRFLRAGLVTPLPGGLGIDPAGIMTGARGASLQARAMAKVTPLPAVSREARPGLSDGINLRRKRRGGAPRGEPPSLPPVSGGGYRGGRRARRRGLHDAPFGAPLPSVFCGEENHGLEKLGRGCVARTILIALRPLAPSLPSPASGGGEEDEHGCLAGRICVAFFLSRLRGRWRAKRAGGGKCSTLALASRPLAPSPLACAGASEKKVEARWRERGASRLAQATLAPSDARSLSSGGASRRPVGAPPPRQRGRKREEKESDTESG
jgi:hypothetical protein